MLHLRATLQASAARKNEKTKNSLSAEIRTPGRIMRGLHQQPLLTKGGQVVDSSVNFPFLTIRPTAVRDEGTKASLCDSVGFCRLNFSRTSDAVPFSNKQARICRVPYCESCERRYNSSTSAMASWCWCGHKVAPLTNAALFLLAENT